MGCLKSAVGLKGWFKTKTYTEKVDSLLQHSVWHIGNKKNEFHIFELEDGFVANNGLRVKLVGIDTRTVAEHFQGSMIAVPRQKFLPVGSNEYYWVDLIDMQVINHRHEIIGTVVNLMGTGAHDVLVVTNSKERSRQVLIPFVDVYIQSVDMSKKIINVDWESDY